MWAASRRPLSSEEMAVIEQNAVALGVTIDTLMENAGRAAAEEAARHLPSPPARVAVVASTGNNGGDGTCAAYYLQQWGYSPEVWLVRPPSEIRSRAARRCFDRIEHRLPVHPRVPRAEELATMPLVLDALLGTGQSERLRPPIAEAVQAIRTSRAPVLSIDLPTGVLDPDGLRPSWTVTFTTVKEEMVPEKSGEVTVRDIGMPSSAWQRTGPGEFLFFHAPDGRTDRGRTGRVVVVGGGPYAGAPALAALAALRSGAERATVVTPEGAAASVQSFSPNLVVRAFGTERFRPTDVAEILEFIRAAPPRAVVVGMGAGTHPETTEALGTLLGELVGKIPLVVDADALLALPDAATLSDRAAGANPPALVATPNSGEFERVFGGKSNDPLDRRVEVVSRIASERRLTLLVKGEPDLVSDGETTVENSHHPVAITVGGAGDVLAGVVGSLLSQGVRALHAARLATYWVGEAGYRAASARSFGLVATDVIDQLPAALLAGLERVRHGP
jgi:ADP-dependent NAD(P)H-hydrate dehydratase / NAD(P)H-hydrate epimerase